MTKSQVEHPIWPRTNSHNDATLGIYLNDTDSDIEESRRCPGFTVPLAELLVSTGRPVVKSIHPTCCSMSTATADICQVLAGNKLPDHIIRLRELVTVILPLSRAPLSRAS